jgi:hypothetical protein
MENMIYDVFENLNSEISDSAFFDLLQMAEDFENEQQFLQEKEKAVI